MTPQGMRYSAMWSWPIELMRSPGSWRAWRCRCRTFAQVKPHRAEKTRFAFVFDFTPPAGFEPAHTAPEYNPAYSRYQQERGLGFTRGARRGRAECLASPLAGVRVLPVHLGAAYPGR